MTNLNPAIPHALRRDQAVLLVIDIQERLLAAMSEVGRERLIGSTVTLIRGAQALGVPILLTEQYPKGLGPTAVPVRAALPEGLQALTKLEFSSAGTVAAELGALRSPEAGPRQVILCGMETHVCVYQTARDLRAQGHQVYVAADAVLSRTEDNRGYGLGLMASAGAVIGCVESALFDLCQRAGTPEFKVISSLVR